MTDCVPMYGFFIGLTDDAAEGNYVWNDGVSTCPIDYSNWHSGEPNNNPKQDVNGQDCVQMWFRANKNANGEWDDEYCDYRPKGVVCQTRVSC
ncbi:low affinity immunoglobulin epsilon Fc receptor-like [Glandiceps talaboti]